MRIHIVKPLAAFAALGALVACTASEPAAGTRAPEPGSSKAPGRRTVATTIDTPKVQMQIGTKYVKGALVRVCGPRRCEDGSGRPKTLRLSDQRLVMFVLEKEPEAAAVSVRRAGSEKVVATKTLRPGTTMAYVADLKDARYDVFLDSEWKDMQARWSFTLVVDDP